MSLENCTNCGCGTYHGDRCANCGALSREALNAVTLQGIASRAEIELQTLDRIANVLERIENMIEHKLGLRH